MKVKLLTGTDKKSIEKRIKIVAAAGKLSRYPGKVTQVYRSCKNVEKNQRFIGNVINMGHESITDHDYLVFAIEDVTPVIEQILIEERIVSFTIKSRREVDFSTAGYYVPDFRDDEGNILPDNEVLKSNYKRHMEYLFGVYTDLLDMGVKKEDARFVLPYSYHSNIIMGCDAHVLKNLVVRLTKGKESRIPELKELGDKLYEIVCKYIPYYKDAIDNAKAANVDLTKLFLDANIADHESDVLDGVRLTTDATLTDKNIIMASLMRVYGYSYAKAEKCYEKKFKDDENLKKELMRMILINGGEEFSQVSFNFNIPLSLAVLTHLTRHRTHHLVVPDFTPVKNLNEYVIPPALSEAARLKYEQAFAINEKAYLGFKKNGVCDEDLIYFHLSGNKVNVMTNMDGKTLAHIARLRICNKAQWEIRRALTEMRQLVMEQAPIYGSILGPDCEIFLECHEGKESCGKVNVLRGRINEG